MNYILQHLGLGDYILMNGLIRNIIKPNEKYTLFVNKKYEESVCFMYRDIPNLEFKLIPPVEFNRYLILPYIKEQDYKLFVIGYDNFDGSMQFGHSCYKQFNVDFQKRWDDFYVKRDYEKEKILFDKFNLKENEYIFLHEGGSGNDRFIDKSKLNLDLKIFKPDLSVTNNIFDYCYIIEHATEIHVIESSFMFLCESIPTNGKLFAYRSERGKDPMNANVLPTYKKNWIII